MTGAEFNSYPIRCNEAIKSVESGFYCSEAYELSSFDGQQVVKTYPTLCEKALRTAAKGFFCLEAYKLKTIKDSKEHNTYPTRCELL